MSSLQPVRGTQDSLPDDSRRQRAVEDLFRTIAERYGFGEIMTPIFEFTDVFSRTLGDTSDIVTKEMYTFERGGESLTLRPEGTAGVARAFISNGLHHSLPLKLFYRGPMFRYERPQKGRLRQFHQVGLELLGVESPLADVEVIALGAHFLDALGLTSAVSLELNTLGDGDSRAAYRDALVAYLSGHVEALSEDSRARLTRNPLRILDSKDEGDKAIVANAPVFTEYLNAPSRDFFARVTDGLSDLGVGFTVNPRLVRGLDYYCHTAFEFTTTALGAQGTVLAGGRYDGLVKLMGGPATAGIGWAAGVERLAMLHQHAPAAPRPVALVALGAAAERKGMILAQELRRAGFVVDLGYSGNLAKRLKRANKVGAAAAVILGDDELARGVAIVRDLDSGAQGETDYAGLATALDRFRAPDGGRPDGGR